ncbi:ABC transporter substrate-binding protein [Phreatobacter sp. AB_2022a]|uniref:ABC transporter substrate-binding protein n=1 Tax=Phreatobacter sp. AB_2022a TaxID=3003134 RepID=UPI002286E9E3|nr:ABC transporter substrate-binding protein [Phreatobacter sp. AB_2022a]MCZ0737891.1 ABC transporter substrate-binding protein [Phreatobacter sp. AB_2022a]
MSRHRMTRRAALKLGAGVSAAYLTTSGMVTAQGLDKVSYQTNWRAQGEHGGFYLAVTNGIYRKYGIDADIRMGGPQQNPTQLLIGGRVDIIMSNSFEAIHYVRENMPFLCIGAIFQKDPQVIICHPGVGNDSFEALKGKTILVGAGGRSGYWPFLRARFGYTDEQVRPYTFNMAPFLADKNICQQGFVSSEPFAIQQQSGVAPLAHLIADAGFANYNTTFNISRKMVDERTDVVQRFITASLEGWAEYLKGGPNVEAANKAIMRDNPDMDIAKINYAAKVMNERGIVLSGDALTLGIGAMTDARWETFYTQMRDVGVFPPGLDYKKAYDLRFINKGVGKA